MWGSNGRRLLGIKRKWDPIISLLVVNVLAPRTRCIYSIMNPVEMEPMVLPNCLNNEPKITSRRTDDYGGPEQCLFKNSLTDLTVTLSTYLKCLL